EFRLNSIRVENSKNDLFRVRGGHGRDAKVHNLALMLDLKTSVLRHAALRQVHSGEVLDASAEGVVLLECPLMSQMAHAEMTVEDRVGVVPRNDMNVRAVLGQGGANEPLDQVLVILS